jgi:hypothetical protein
MRTTSGYQALVQLAAIATLTACGGQTDPGDAVSVKPELTLQQHTATCQADPRVVAGLVPLDVCVGAELFLRETFDGNGRTCLTCHRPEDNFALDPEFIATLPGNDPLFVAEFNPTLANLERPAQLRARGLILENVDGTEPDPNVRFVLRTVPHNLSMGTSILRPSGSPNPPADRTGWGGDGAPDQGRLADFVNGAINQHYPKSLDRVAGVDFRVATEDEGQLVATFMRELGRKNEINLNSTPFSDSGAETGRQRFLAVGCNSCHRNAGANTGSSNENRNFNIGIESTRNSALSSFPIDGGFGRLPANSDGSFGDGTFSSPPLIEASDTAPFYHTDTTISGAPSHNASSTETIEQATAFYATPAFANSPAGGGSPLPINASDIDNIGRFLRALNAVFNIQIATKRVLGARELGNQFQTSEMDLQNRLLNLAREEVNDALDVLQNAQGGTLNSSAQTWLNQANSFINTALGSTQQGTRMQAMGDAFNRLDLADSSISANVSFNIGAGNLMD